MNGFENEGASIAMPINIIAAPTPTCLKEERPEISKKLNKEPNIMLNPKLVESNPITSLWNNDFFLGWDRLSLIASIGLTLDALIAGNKEERIVTVIPTTAPVIAADGVSTKGPSGRPKLNLFNPSFTRTDKPMPKPIPNPEPITDINMDSDKTSL